MRTDLVFTSDEVINALMQYAEKNGRLPDWAKSWHVNGFTCSQDNEQAITLRDVSFSKEMV